MLSIFLIVGLCGAILMFIGDMYKEEKYVDFN